MRRRLLPLVLALVCALLPAAPAAALDATGLRASLVRLHARLGPWAGAYVVDLATGQPLFAHRENRALAPASNEKLFVTSTALLRFGPDGTLTTTLRAAPGATVDSSGVLHGDVYLIGGGDPTLGDAGLQQLAAALAAQGIVRIDGAVIGDESLFDQLRGGPASGWGPDWDLGGQLSALAWSHGRAAPGGPAAAAATRLGVLLKADGVRYAHRPRAGTLPAGAAQDGPPLAAVGSPTMSELIADTNLPSENFYAEMLAKDLGARFGAGGSTNAGLAVVRAEMATFGVHPRMLDGSGLSHSDRTTARQVVRLLQRMDGQALAPQWEASLPVAGLSGTLIHRMRWTPAAGRCEAKTGTLNGVSALSGYCTTIGGVRVAFSFLENGVWTPSAKRIEDRMVAKIAQLTP